MSEKEKVMKLIKVFVRPIGDETPINYEKPTMMISFEVIPEDKGKLFRDTVRVLNIGTSYRYYGKTPIVFIPIDKIKDIETLTMANMVKKND